MKRLFDDVLESSEHLTLGIPLFDDDGSFMGWQEKPDPHIGKYIMSTIGRDEGFGNNMDITTNGIEVTVGAQKCKHTIY